MGNEPIEGGLFRRNYEQSPVLLPESIRARTRLYKWFLLYPDNRAKFANEIESELGLKYPNNQFKGYLHSHFWKKRNFGDILSGITLWLRTNPHKHDDLLAKARLILKEEQLHYRIDDKGGVHYLIDEEFEHIAQSTIASLGKSKFQAALDSFDKAMNALDGTKPSGKDLIRNIFESLETVFLIITNVEGKGQLNAETVKKELKKIIFERYSSFSDVKDFTDRKIIVIQNWVNFCQKYRHGANKPNEIHDLPLELAISIAGEGMALIRYMVGLDEPYSGE